MAYLFCHREDEYGGRLAVKAVGLGNFADELFGGEIESESLSV
jgi:hypothetical protein